ncbi:hypothetical protein [Pseudomonas paeninsulae]|uniref:hypothetical protein n=1 Tax=Pseudomonas paeninsulae TaxID=3110772 RepID=UPI002D799D25|nr:hypothetical protein [Pseudomonas sp. IT1137]
MDDFYIDKKGLAAYFEMQWLDKLRDDGVHEVLKSKSKSVPDYFILSDHTSNVARFISSALERDSISPETVLEVGPALGRNCYELVKKYADIKSVTVVEPSQRLLSNFKRILIDGSGCEFPYIKSASELESLYFQTESITKDCSHINFSLIKARRLQELSATRLLN